jgi:hypothetical protein
MSKRILELSEDDLYTAIREFVQKHYMYMWSPPGLDVVVWKNSHTRLTLEWKFLDEPEKGAR